MSAETASRTGGDMSLIEHLTELRNRIMRTLIAVAVCAVVAWFLYPIVLDILLGPLRASAPPGIPGLNGRVIALDPLQPFAIRLRVSSYLAIAMALPVILWQLWRFIAPGLYENEKRYGVAFIAAGTLLFVTGAAIAFWTMPKALEFLQTIGGEDNFVQTYSIDKYLRLITYMMLAFGIGFEFPLVVVALLLMGVVSTTQLRKSRRMVIVIVAVIVAVITPSGDPISMLALTVPMILLYEAAIIFGRVRDRRRRRRPAEA